MSSVFLKQFMVHPLIPMSFLGVDVSFTNSSLAMVTVVFCVIAMLWLSVRTTSLVPSGIQAFGETILEFTEEMVSKIVGDSSLTPLIFSIMVFVAGCNILGLVPGAFTATSHVAVTFGISAALIIFLTILGIVRNGLSFFGLFLPHGVPLWLAPLMVPIEITTYVFRTISLSLRLTANMVAGHVMLKVIAVLGAKLTLTGFLVVPTLFLAGLTVFEFFVAILQAYIFAILSCVYLSDAFKKH